MNISQLCLTGEPRNKIEKERLENLRKVEEETGQITTEISETESKETVRSKPKFLFFLFFLKI